VRRPAELEALTLRDQNISVKSSYRQDLKLTGIPRPNQSSDTRSEVIKAMTGPYARFPCTRALPSGSTMHQSHRFLCKCTANRKHALLEEHVPGGSCPRCSTAAPGRPSRCARARAPPGPPALPGRAAGPAGPARPWPRRGDRLQINQRNFSENLYFAKRT
jgi:hypothetical protein